MTLLTPNLRHRPRDRASIISGLVFAVLFNGGLLGTVWFVHRPGAAPKETMTFVDAQLVRFGKPRDLSFLPHVQATPKVQQPKKVLKLTDDPDKPHKELPKPPEDEKEPDKPLSKLAEQFKNLRDPEDDRATQEAAAEGDPKGVRGGTAAEASGDPYILEIVAAVTERWTVPTMLTPGELSKLSASACLKIDDDGTLVEYKIVDRSGNDLFDGSLDTTLGSMKTLPKPHGKFAGAARRGKLCPVFTKQ
jgi:outer membrane biosynthesis protein TonB